MSVRLILEEKGYDVFTLKPDDSVKTAVDALAERKIGALVVTDGNKKIAGILSERDIVRALAKEGADILEQPLKNIMTAKVRTCHESHTINDVMELMTAGRFRHLPVEKEGLLLGIISIGDVVKRRIEDAEREAEDIKAYIATA